MTKRFLLLTTLLTAPAFALAQEASPAVPTAAQPSPAMETASPDASTQAAPAVDALTDNAQLDEGIRGLQNDWATIKYQEPNKDTQLTQMKKLAEKASALSAQYPAYAEPKIWQAIILSTVAGMDGGLGALDYAKEAKGLLEQAIKINGNALDGSAYTSLGSLYYKVPGWPIGFGNAKKARDCLDAALALDPNGLDANFFYGDYLASQGQYAKAKLYLQRALKAPSDPDRPVWDSGRRGEVRTLLADVDKKMSR